MTKPTDSPYATMPPNPLRDEILALLDEGHSQREVGRMLGVTKNTVAGIWARAGRGTSAQTTMLDRLAALHDRMDAMLAECVGIGRVPNAPKSLTDAATAPKPDFRARSYRSSR